jgi:hypothetical protein
VAAGEGYYLDVLASGSNLEDLRTDVVIDYPDSADLLPDGTKKRKRIHLADLNARAAYNEGNPRTFFVVEGAASQIDTTAEATAFATALLSDVSNPPQERRLQCPLFPFGEVQDYYRARANGVDGDTDEYLAVYSLEHSIGGESGGAEAGDPGTTIVHMRGTRPSRRGLWGPGSWAPFMASPQGNSGAPPTAGPAAPSNVTAAKVQGGVAVAFDPDTTLGKPARVHELHLSTAGAGFTPDASTYRAKARDINRFEVGDLVPGVTYYAKVVPQDDRGQRGTPSAAVAIDAGYTTPAAMLPAITYATLPYNPDFEANSTPGAPPDTWTVSGGGAWGIDVLLDSGTIYSGAYALKWPAASGITSNVASQLFVVQAGEKYAASGWYRTAGYSGLLTSGIIAFDWYSDAITFLSTTVPARLALAGSNGGWTKVADIATAPAAAKYAKLRLAKTNNVPHDLWIDAVMVAPASFVQEAWTVVPVFTNGWTNLGAPSENAAYFKDANGIVHFKGTIVPGTRNAQALTIGIGYRPLGTQQFAVAGGGGVFVRVDITAAGVLIADVNVSAATWVSLNGLSYAGEQ